MIYRFLLLSDEVDDFKREIQISSQATFFDFHTAIMETSNYDDKQLYSFFICEEDWSKKTEITLIEMDTSSEEDSYIMDETPLDELIEDEHQKLIYVFDPLSERVFFIELREIIVGEDLEKATCTKATGNPPEQFKTLDIASGNINTDIDENFYGEDTYDDEDLDGLVKGSFDDLSDERL